LAQPWVRTVRHSTLKALANPLGLVNAFSVRIECGRDPGLSPAPTLG
jgi:hypothetical protein